MKYLVVYNNSGFKEITAENIKDCIVQLADWTGDKTELLLKALNGCELVDDYIDMYEYFGSCKINFIFLLQDTIYEGVYSDG